MKDANNNINKNVMPVYYWVIPVCVALLLVSISQTNFLLFHVLAELFAVIVAIIMSVVVWQMYPFTRNTFLMYLGSGYIWIAVLDTIHMLTYKGMNIFPVADGNTAIQFWIATRYLEAFLLITSPWFLTNKLNYKSIFAAFGLAAASIYYSIISGYFPLAFVEGYGLTDFKVISEYIIIAMLAFAIVLLWKKRSHVSLNIIKLVIASVVLTMCAEMAFTLYIDLYGISNIVGHLFKFISFWLIFIAMVRTTLHEPFSAMAKSSSTYDAIPDATIVVDHDGVIYQVNQAACNLAGVEKKELIGESSHRWFHGSETDSEDCLICKNSRDGNKIYAYEVKDEKNERWLDFTLSPVGDATEYGGMVEVIRDITRKKTTEQELLDVNELKNSIVENLPAMLFVKRASDHRYVEWNKAAEGITGLTRKEMLGKNDFDFFTKDEAEFYISMDKKVLSEGALYDIPEETVHTKFKGIRLLHTQKIPIYNQKGEASYLLGISQDITENKETEEMVRRSQKMEAVGQLSGGIAHDFNNQLGIVTGYLEFLKEFLKNEEKQKKWVENATKAAYRCVELTRQLMLFSRTKSPEKSSVDVNGVITDIEDIIEKSVTPEVNVLYQLEDNLWPAMLDEGELGDAIVNILINARDAMEQGGSIIIRTSNVYLDDEVMIADQGVKPGEYLMLEVQDNGKGMSDEVIEHIYEPFFTTKPVGSGTGLGMSMVYSFVQRCDGTIKIDSTEGVGTSIKIYIPRAEEEESFSRSKIDPQRIIKLPDGKETVLIVDDEIDLLNLTGEYISSLGYKIFKANNAYDAIETLKQEDISLVFSDIVMPGGMNGYDLAALINKDYPQVKILLSSGYMGKASKGDFKGIIINKPYTKQQVALEIRTALDNTSQIV